MWGEFDSVFTKGTAGSEIKLGDKLSAKESKKISCEVPLKTATAPVSAVSSDQMNCRKWT